MGSATDRLTLVSEEDDRARLSRLHITAVLSAVAAGAALVAAAVGYYLGFSDAEETLALPHPPGAFEISVLVLAVVLLVVMIVAIVRYNRLSRCSD